MAAVYTNTNWGPNAPHTDQLLIPYIATAAVLWDVSTARSVFYSTYVSTVLNGQPGLTANTLIPIFAAGIYQDGITASNNLLTYYQQTGGMSAPANNAGILSLLSALAVSEDVNDINTVLNYSLNSSIVAPQHAAPLINLIALGNEIGLQTATNFLTNRWNDLVAYLTPPNFADDTNMVSIVNTIVGAQSVAATINTLASTIQSLTSSPTILGNLTTIAVPNAQSNVNWLTNNYAALLQWFTNNLP